MDLTNRVVIVTGALIWIFIVLVIILLAWAAPAESADQLEDLAGYMANHNNDAAKLIITFGGFILVLMAAIIIIFEIAPPDTGSLKVEKVGAGDARIGTDEIAQRLQAEVLAISNITDAQVQVQGRGRKAEVALTLHVGQDADLSSVADEACRRSREVVEQQMGVGLAGAPKAQLHYRELRVARPQGEANPPASAEAPSAYESAPADAGGIADATGPTDEPIDTPQEDRQAGV